MATLRVVCISLKTCFTTGSWSGSRLSLTQRSLSRVRASVLRMFSPNLGRRSHFFPALWRKSLRSESLNSWPKESRGAMPLSRTCRWARNTARPKTTRMAYAVLIFWCFLCVMTRTPSFIRASSSLILRDDIHERAVPRVDKGFGRPQFLPALRADCRGCYAVD